MDGALHLVAVEPTLFFVRQGEGLRQLAHLHLRNDGEPAQASLALSGAGIAERLPLGRAPSGESIHELYLPEAPAPVALRFTLYADETPQDERTVEWQPERHWEIYLLHYSHHDLGYTDLPGRLLEEHAGFLDEVVRYCEATADWPEDSRFRYVIEQAWSVVYWAEHRPPDQVARLVRAVQAGQVEVTALYENETSELCGHEELVRLLYPAFRLRREHGIEIVSAEHNDIPGFTWGFASILPGAGVRYFCPGVPTWYFGQGEGRVHPAWDEAAVLPMEMPGGFWWEGPDGQRVLLWYDLHGGEWYPSSYAQALRELPGMLRALEKGGYGYDQVSYTLRGGHRDNAPPILRYAEIAREWNSRWAYPRWINATRRQFMGALEGRWGRTLRTLRGELPGTDYTAAATCTPRETALNRNTHDALLTAEKLATLASLLDDKPAPPTDAAACNLQPDTCNQALIDAAYRDVLAYDGHCWGMAHPGGPAQDGCWSEKSGFAYRAAALAHDVTVKAANRLADRIAYPAEAYYLTVFNPLSWPRSDVVRAPVRPWEPSSMPMHWRQPAAPDEGPMLFSGGAVGRRLVVPPVELIGQPFELIDETTGQPVPYQLLRLQDAQAAQPWAPERFALGQVDPRHLVEIAFLAEDLPPLGFKTYRLAPCAAWPEYPTTATATTLGAENRFFKMLLDPEVGAIASLFDAALDRELVDPEAGHGLAQLIVRWSHSGEQVAGRASRVAVDQLGPILTTLRVEGRTLGCPQWAVEFTLYNPMRRIDVAARLLRDVTPMIELYYAFPFLIPNPRFRFEGTASVIEPLRDQLPGSNTDYYTVQHWVDAHNDQWGVTWAPLDAPMAELGGLWPGYVSEAHHGVRGPGYGHAFLKPGELQRGHIYSLAMYNNFRTNFINVHTGDVLLRYALGTHTGDWRTGRAREFGWNAANPPLSVWMRGPQAGSLAATISFAEIDAPNVMLLTLKPAEDGRGLILRLAETEGRETTAAIALPHLNIRQAWATNLVEEDQQPLPCTGHAVEAPLRPFGLTTVRVILG